ncbi:MAG: hypothetical protein ACYTFW_21245, partial [Planctomycetota bacterium]
RVGKKGKMGNLPEAGRLRTEGRGQKSVDRRLLNVCWSSCLNHVLYAIGFLYIIRWRWLVVQLIFIFFIFFCGRATKAQRHEEVWMLDGRGAVRAGVDSWKEEPSAVPRAN